MDKKPEGNDLFLTIITILVALFIVVMTISFNKYQDAKEDKDKYQRLVEIYKKTDSDSEETKKRYVKKLNKAEEELKKVKEETNYKGYADKSSKEKSKEDREAHSRIFKGIKGKDVLVVEDQAVKSSKVSKPTLIVNSKGEARLLVPKDYDLPKGTVKEILPEVDPISIVEDYNESNNQGEVIHNNNNNNNNNNMDNPINNTIESNKIVTPTTPVIPISPEKPTNTIVTPIPIDPIVEPKNPIIPTTPTEPIIPDNTTPEDPTPDNTTPEDPSNLVEPHKEEPKTVDPDVTPETVEPHKPVEPHKDDNSTEPCDTDIPLIPLEPSEPIDDDDLEPQPDDSKTDDTTITEEQPNTSEEDNGNQEE
ncbi:membrane protein [Staphylococcus phage CF5]|uniref:Membrane protein n=1 Tax=Staphylococcus phage CF5 TaxID=3113739 RepID=A0AAX4J774_9CAUD|nr:membrane protein [Staphylococcus phage CF5]